MILSTLFLLAATIGDVAESTDTIALRLYRFDGKSGSALVSNGIPLPPGRLKKSDLGNLRLIVEGEEQAMRAEALEGLHPDGSLRSLLLQFQYPVPTSGWRIGKLIVGESRSLPDIQEPEGFDRGKADVVALPSDPEYLVTTRINGPTVSARYNRTAGPTFGTYEVNFAKYADTHWQHDRDNWGGANYYDRALIYYAFWVRTANPTYFRRATLLALNYRINYLEKNKYATSAYWSMPEGIEQHYLLTGDESSRFAIARVAEQFAGMDVGDTLHITWAETRGQARTLQALYLAWRLNAKGPRQLDLPKILDAKLKTVLEIQRPDGSNGWPATCYESLNFMHGLMNDQLISIYTNYRADTAIVRYVKKNVDYLWKTQWLPRDRAFKYMSGRCKSNAQGEDVGGPHPTPDLNMLFVTGFGWIYYMTGDDSYRRAGDQIFEGGVRGAYWTGSKQFNQTFTNSYKYVAYRLGKSRLESVLNR